MMLGNDNVLMSDDQRKCCPSLGIVSLANGHHVLGKFRTWLVSASAGDQVSQSGITMRDTFV